MGTASRKTWLEKQTDEIQFDVLNWDESGQMTLEQMAAQLKAEHQIEVPASTLHHSLQALHRDGGVRLVKMMSRFFKENPEADSHLLSRAYVLAQAASEEFRKAQLRPGEIIEAAQVDKRLALQQREIEAKEESNRLKEREVAAKEAQVQAAREKIAVAVGGMDGRALYLQSAQDVLKKLHTYEDLKSGLDAHQGQIIAELAQSAEAFARKLEHEA